MTAKEVVKRLKADDWFEVRQEGGHKHFADHERPGETWNRDGIDARQQGHSQGNARQHLPTSRVEIEP
jgi:hypothetical protein